MLLTAQRSSVYAKQLILGYPFVGLGEKILFFLSEANEQVFQCFYGYEKK